MPVNLEIQSLVSSALAARRICLDHLAKQEWQQAGIASQQAAIAANQAFFHHDMLPALYFPDEHLYAVYLPLFLPISVPLLGALLKLLTNSQEKQRKQKRQQQIKEQLAATLTDKSTTIPSDAVASASSMS